MDEVLEFSGDMPEEDVTMQLLTEEELLANQNITSTILQTTTMASPVDPSYSPNYFRIGWLSAKCLLALLVLILTLALRKRDFLKMFVLFLLVPILLECGFDIFTEIKTSATLFGQREQVWSYYHGKNYNTTLQDLQHEAIPIYEEILNYYTTYNIYTRLDYFPLTSYILGDFIFWSTLFSSLVAFFFSHKAITKPEEISYIKYFWCYIKVQIFPILLTLLDTLISLFKLPAEVQVPATALTRIIACLVAFTLITQAFMSLIVFCVRRDEYTKSSPYDQVRNSKWRLFWFIIFQIVIQAMNAPYIVWSGLSLTEDFSRLFGIPISIPLSLASDALHLHLSLFLLRPLVFLLSTILFLAPYRRKFTRSFCPCCIRD